MKYLMEFESFEKMVVSRANTNGMPVHDCVDFGRAFFDLRYEKVMKKLDEMEGDKVVICSGRVVPVSEGETSG